MENKAERLDFVIDGSKIAELFGIQNFNNAENAFLEIVKNSYDAGATSVDIFLTENLIRIKDNGIGMDSEIIKNNWMHVGKSEKKYSFLDINNNERIYSGSKGVGRFAIARLGEKVSIISKKRDSNAIEWETDWNYNYLSNYDNVPFEQGTEITISNLRESISREFAERLCYFLGISENYSQMTVLVHYYDELFECKMPYDNISIGKNCLTSIKLKYSASKSALVVNIESDEFAEEAQRLIDDSKKRIDIKKYNVEIDLSQKMQFNSQLKRFSKEDIISALGLLGDFSSELFFNNLYKKSDAELNHYKRLEKLPYFIEGEEEIGIALYRNSFCIANYDGSIDWLALGKRSRKSPAAASHPTGSWRVRENQICGKVVIDKKENDKIVEMQNRQGITSNIYFILLKEIIIAGINEFEKYRQSISRIVNPKDYSSEKESSDKVIDSFIKNPEKAAGYSSGDFNRLADHVSSALDNYKKAVIQVESIVEDQNYSIGLLNSLSTIGLRASWRAHEIDTDRNNYTKYSSLIENSLKEYGMWDTLNDEQHTLLSHRNVPELLNSNSKATQSIISFIDSILTSVEKDKFETKNIDLKNLIGQICNDWEREFAFVTFHINIECSSYYGSDNIFETIFNNLILNSIQINDKLDSLDVYIDIKKEHGKLLVIYRDNGIGLSSAFSSDPFEILRPHTTTRKKGHGLGMWIVNNTIVSTKGEVLSIYNDNGFVFEFLLGEKADD